MQNSNSVVVASDDGGEKKDDYEMRDYHNDSLGKKDPFLCAAFFDSWLEILFRTFFYKDFKRPLLCGMANPLLYAAKENPFSLALKPIPKFFFVSCTQWQGVFFFILTNGGQLVFPYTYATIIGEQIGNFRTFFYPPLLSFFSSFEGGSLAKWCFSSPPFAFSSPNSVYFLWVMGGCGMTDRPRQF